MGQPIRVVRTRPLVRCPIGRLREAARAEIARIRFEAGVQAYVLRQVVAVEKSAAADVARMLLLGVVRAGVRAQFRGAGRAPSAHGAHAQAGTRMLAQVTRQFRRQHEALGAVAALEPRVAGVQARVRGQEPFGGEAFVALRARVDGR